MDDLFDDPQEQFPPDDMFSDPIDRFEDQFEFLSNFFACQVTYNKVKYPSSEHAYQAQKSTSSKLRSLFAYLQTPYMAKKFGEAIRLREDWEQVKLSIMAEIVRAKFQQNPALAKKLLATKNRALIEGNTWGDKFWGVYLDEGGQNHLGKILMRIRKELQEGVC